MDLGEVFTFELIRAHRLYHTSFYRLTGDVDVQQHYPVLLILYRRNGKALQRDLCEELHIEKSNMVAIIDLLEKKGLVTREVYVKDKRGKLIVLTPAANMLINLFKDSIGFIDSFINDELSWQELHTFLYVFKRINEKLVDLEDKTKVLTASSKLRKQVAQKKLNCELMINLKIEPK